MTTRLAKLADLRTLLGVTATDNDALFLTLIEAASARCAEQELAGRPLTRQESIVEYPRGFGGVVYSRYFDVARWPIESVASIKQLMAAGDDDAFDVETALEEFADYDVWYERGRIERLNSTWALLARHVQIIYTGGYGDPANLEVITVSGNADAVGVRSGEITVDGASLAYPGATTAIDGLTNNDTTYIWVANVGGVATIQSAVDGTGWPATAHEKLAEVVMLSGAIVRILDRRSQLQPPVELQRGVLMEAVQQFHHRNTGGAVGGSMVGGGSVTDKVLSAHPMLVSACAPLRRVTI